MSEKCQRRKSRWAYWATRPARSRCASMHFLMAYRKAAMYCGKPPRMQDRVSRSRQPSMLVYCLFPDDLTESSPYAESRPSLTLMKSNIGQEEIMAKRLSEQLADLSVQAKSTEDAVTAAEKEAHDKVLARKEQAPAAAPAGGRKGEQGLDE